MSSTMSTNSVGTAAASFCSLTSIFLLLYELNQANLQYSRRYAVLCCAVVLCRQGVGVTGGTPFGFDVGQPRDAPGSALPGIDKGVIGMRVGGQRRLLVPPQLVSL